jgi:hypothetical protein
MARLSLFVAGRLPLAFGVLGIWCAIERWRWFQTLPRFSSVRSCGNCFLAAVGALTELGLLGLLVVAVSILNIPYCSRNGIYWCCAAVGILLTPMVIGVPLFAFAFLMLMRPIRSVLFKGAVRVAFRL